MIYKEEKRDLFSVPEQYFLVQCISADFAMNTGIALKFNAQFDTKNKTKKAYPNYFKEEWYSPVKDVNPHGDCIRIERVFNLVTNRKYWQAPTILSVREALRALCLYCENENIKYLAMPKIGCGLNKFKWDFISQLIKDTFKNTDIEILVCYL